MIEFPVSSSDLLGVVALAFFVAVAVVSAIVTALITSLVTGAIKP